MQKRMQAISLMWNIAASWLVSAWWCSGVVAWFALVVVELAFVAAASRTFSLGGIWLQLAITVVGDVTAYHGKQQGWFCHLEEVLNRRLSAIPALAEGEEAAPGHNSTSVEEMQEDVEERDNMTWAIILIVLVSILVLNMILLMTYQRRPDNQVTAISGIDCGAAPHVARIDGGAGNGFVGIVPESRVAARAKADPALPNTVSSSVAGRRLEVAGAAGRDPFGAMTGSTSERVDPEKTTASQVEMPFGQMNHTPTTGTSPSLAVIPETSTPETLDNRAQSGRTPSLDSLTASSMSTISDASWVFK